MQRKANSSRFIKIAAVTGGILVLLGVLLLGLNALTPEYVDASGVLHEWFFLLPLGFGCLLCGCAALIIAGVSAIIRKIKEK